MTDKKYPSPEEVQKEFEEFVQKRFGNNVKVVSHAMPGPLAEGPKDIEMENEKTKEFLINIENFNLKPKEVKAHLDRFVIKQDEAKKALAIAVCDHYNHVKQCIDTPQNDTDEYAKQNVLILGPTGVGKTYLVKQIAKLIGVPFIKADATRFSETGYVGANVDDMVRDLVTQANGDIDTAKYGIIYIDEIDKIASPVGLSGGKDVSGRGVQSGLLKLMEETEIDLSSGNDMKSQMQAFMEIQSTGKLKNKVINTKHILFIVSGAFSKLEDVVKNRMNQNGIGFSASLERHLPDDDLLSNVTTEDLSEFGFEPEFIGRLPIRVACQKLHANDLMAILTESEGSILNQYRKAFKAYGIDISFEDDALREIAERSYHEKTGARALMTVTEAALRKFKYELPSTPVQFLNVTKAVITTPQAELERILTTESQDKTDQVREDISLFEVEFFEKHGITIGFSDEATQRVGKESATNEESIHNFCTKLLFGYEHGLNLIRQNTGQTSFKLGVEVVEAPQTALEQMIIGSYKSLRH